MNMPDQYDAAMELALMDPPPTSGNDVLNIPNGGGAASVRTILQWAASEEGCRRLDEDIRDTLFQLAAQLI